MERKRFIRKAALVAMMAVALALPLLLSGCGNDTSDTADKPGASATALNGLDAARSALSTMAPDAKLLVVQTAQAVEPTGTPVWAYMFGNEADDKTYVVYMAGEQVMAAQEYGAAGLSKEEWAKVPTDEFKIDSDVAYEKAFEKAGGKGMPEAYVMGIQLYVPEAVKDEAGDPYVWYVTFAPGESGVSTETIAVDGKTGEASIAKIK